MKGISDCPMDRSVLMGDDEIGIFQEVPPVSQRTEEMSMMISKW
jgi:hypothetical protein